MNIFNTSEYVSCKPISSLNDLLNWPFTINENKCELSRKFNVELLKRPYHKKNPNTNKKIIVCHDMKNNYLEDKYFQGFNIANAFSFYHWNLIDMFIYFSHHFVTIPPESWINSAHTNNVRILGTFITEFKDGTKICDEFLGDQSKIDTVVAKLVEITLYYGFDGWLINIENEIKNVDNLKYFVKSLTQSLKKIDPELYKIVWYDSVIESGKLEWQNELNELNKEFFDLVDAFFVNYTWKDINLQNTKKNALDRLSDVFVGVDVFGRGCLGDGGFNTNIAFDAIDKYNMNVALFAPGWLHECQNPNDFIQNCERFWKLLECYTQKHELLDLPIVTTFTHGCAKNFYINGKSLITSNNFSSSNNNNNNKPYDSIGWYNLNLQSLIPSISINDPCTLVEWCYEDAFYGGNSLLVKNLEKLQLFQCNINLSKDRDFFIEYVFKKTNVNSQNERSLQDICLNIEYINETNKSIFKSLNLNSILVQNNDFNLKVNESKNNQSWQIRSYNLHLNTDINLKSINLLILNKNNNFESDYYYRLGMIRFFETNSKELCLNKNEFQLLSISDQLKYRSSVFYLNKFSYLCIDLSWPKLGNFDLNYYNILIDNRNLIEIDKLKTRIDEENKKSEENRKQISYDDQMDQVEFLLIGSSRIEKFHLCFRLNQDYRIESTSFSQPASLSFNLYVHAVDKCMNNLFEFNTDSFDQTNSKSLIKSKISIPGVKKYIENSNINFIDDIIFDFEFFNI
jgi:mannosyl-glycoprotein endo-beta-N-acetylglucosaminidase